MSNDRKRIIAGNWKMNLTISEGENLVELVLKGRPQMNCEVIFAPPFTQLSRLAQIINSHKNFYLSGQNCHYEQSGAFTGEVSPPMLKDAGAQYVILGHSERRSLFGETNKMVALKVKAALRSDLQVILCCGESLEERESNRQETVVANQLKMALEGVSAEAMASIVIAYEPVWAIGTGKSASPEQANEMHQFIRGIVGDQYSQEVAAVTSILYGGSVKANNSRELLNCEHIDGALVGGASLKADEFLKIIGAA